jgi:DNA-binding transcriptional MerR regulator
MKKHIRKPPAKPGKKPARSGKAGPGPREYSIDEFARVGRSTVRNVRAYQDRGLLPPPERRGRAGIYTEAHLARLRLIGQLLNRGYTLGNIGELINAWEQGQDLRDLLGLERALMTPWSEELPAYFTMPELLRMFGKAATPEAIRKATELEVLQLEGLRFRAPRPQFIHAGVQLVAMGIPLTELLDIVRMLRGNVERVANELVQLIVKYVFERYLKGELPPAKDVPQLADMVWKLRPLADMAVETEVARAMDKAIHQHLGDLLSHIFDHLQDKPARK